MIKKKNHKVYILPVILSFILTVTGIGVAWAYLGDAEQMTNTFTIGEVKTKIVENFDPPDSLVTGNNDYTKAVQAQNTGYSDCYIRIAAEFSSEEVKDSSWFSPDGTTWYKASEYKDHLPTGWIYIDNPNLGGPFYYYTGVISPGGKTPELFKRVRTFFETEDDITPYDIYVYAEAVQTYGRHGEDFRGSGKYIDAWKHYQKEASSTNP